MTKTIVLVVFLLVPPWVLLAEEETHNQIPRPETEMLASSSFQSLAIVQPVIGNWNIEARLYHAPGIHEDVMLAGGSYTFKIRKRASLTPGFNFFAGRDERSAPAASLRYHLRILGKENARKLIFEGSLFQALLPTVNGRHDTHADLPRLAVKTKKFTAGGTCEFVRYRDEDEIKVGSWLQYHMTRRWSVIGLPLWSVGKKHHEGSKPAGFEFRAGVAFNPFGH